MNRTEGVYPSELGIEEEKKEKIKKFTTSEYRLERINKRMLSLRALVSEHLTGSELNNGGGRARDEQIRSIFLRIENLINSLKDFEFSDEDQDQILEVLDIVEQLGSGYYKTIRPNIFKDSYEQRQWERGRDEFIDEYQARFDDLQTRIDKLPTDRKSEIEFRDGYLQDLKGALDSGDVKKAGKLIIQIDRLISDNYSEYKRRKSIVDSEMTPRVRVGLVSSNSIELSGLIGQDKPSISIRKRGLFTQPKTYEIIVELSGLSEEQEEIWKAIQ